MNPATSAAAGTQTTTTEAPSLDSILDVAGVTGQEERSNAAKMVSALVQEAMKDTKVASTNLTKAIKDWIAAIDVKLSAQVNEIMHHPDFQKLEGSWRGLHYLVHQSETGPNLKIRVLNATKQQLIDDFETAPEFDQSGIWKKIYESEYGQLGGKPYGMIVGDFEFGIHPQDDVLLRGMAQVCACAFAPFIAAASPKMFNPRWEDFSKINEPRDLSMIFETDEYVKWRSFRERDDSRFVALTLPRVLARLPYGANTKPVKAFNFEEAVDGKDHSKYLWMSAAWAYAARVTDAFAQDGWFMRTRGVEGGGIVKGLPVHIVDDGGGKTMKCPTEVPIPDRREMELSNLGFLPLLHYRDTDNAVFIGAQSCQKPAKYNKDSANANAQLSTKINYMLCVSRFAHFLKVMGRDKLGSFAELDSFKLWLNNWISNYVHPSPQFATPEGLAEKPLAAARVDVEPVPGKPGWYNAVAYLRPHFQLEGFDTSMRLVAEMPVKKG